MEKEELSTVVDILAEETKKKASSAAGLMGMSGILSIPSLTSLIYGQRYDQEMFVYAGLAGAIGGLACLTIEYFKSKDLKENIDALSYLAKNKGDE